MAADLSLKDVVLASVSHDLRTPLTTIKALAQSAALQGNEAGAAIEEQADRLDRLVNDLLDLDRLSRGMIEPALRDADVGALVGQIVTGSDLLTGRNVDVDAKSVRIPVDVAKVERIVENLLSNTVRHAPEGANVWVKVEEADQGVIISVEDDGPGVSEDQRMQIFEPFTTGPEPGGALPGVGIGLSLVWRFAELHGGRAWVEDREGGGAAFRVFLPDRPPASPSGNGDGF